MKVAYVRWLDAGAQYQKWLSGDGLDCRWELHSAGVVVYENKEIITLAADFDGEKYRDCASIPKANILEIRYFEIKKRGKKL